MFALLWQPLRDDSVTQDEPAFVAGGYSYWQGHRHTLNVEHPPLIQLWTTLPLLVLPVTEPAEAARYFDPGQHAPLSPNWRYDYAPPGQPFPQPAAFYYYPVVETMLYGRDLLLAPANDTDRLLFWCRLMQALLALGVGVVIFLWARTLAGNAAGLLALSTWVFQPIALAYGHLVLTDTGLALTLTLAVWQFTRLLEQPDWRRLVAAGLATGLALATKYTALLLVPIFGALVLLSWWKNRRLTWHTLGVPVLAWLVVLALYFPHWAPAPPITAMDAAALAVPGWFRALRWVLIPAEYFKGLSIVLVHVAHGHPAYLAGEWSRTGWWYYFPVALLVKSPAPWLLLGGGAAAWLAWRWRRLGFAELAPLVAALVFLAGAMTSKANIGVRHVLPVLPLVAVAVAVHYRQAGGAARGMMWLLAGTLVFTAWRAHPLFLPYGNELTGGPRQGPAWLLDSNYDWGQDAGRLKAFLDERQIDHVYVHYFGIGRVLERAGIRATAIKPEQARGLREGWLVVSASYLMRPEWDWLRTTQEPVARVGYTLFVYRLP